MKPKPGSGLARLCQPGDLYRMIKIPKKYLKRISPNLPASPARPAGWSIWNDPSSQFVPFHRHGPAPAWAPCPCGPRGHRQWSQWWGDNRDTGPHGDWRGHRPPTLHFFYIIGLNIGGWWCWWSISCSRLRPYLPRYQDTRIPGYLPASGWDLWLCWLCWAGGQQSRAECNLWVFAAIFLWCSDSEINGQQESTAGARPGLTRAWPLLHISPSHQSSTRWNVM